MSGKWRRLPGRLWLDVCLDVALFVAFTVDSNTSLTGIAVHEWLGIVFGIAFVIHLALHWDWVLRTVKQLLDTRTNRASRDRAKWIVDLLMYITMGATVVSGWYVSRHAAPVIGVRKINEPFFRNLHGTVANLSVVLVGLHLGLNWKWMRSTWVRFSRADSRSDSRSVSRSESRPVVERP